MRVVKGPEKKYKKDTRRKKMRYSYQRISKRYIIIDQQIARHFMYLSEFLSNPLSHLSNINPFLIQGPQPITINGRNFCPSGNPYNP